MNKNTYFYGEKNQDIQKVSWSIRLWRLWSKKTAFLFVVVALIGAYFGVQQVQKRQNFETGAAANPAEIFFNPNSDTLNLTPKSFPVWINSNAVGVAFVRVEVNFDQTKIMLASDPSMITNTNFGAPIELTTASLANTTGKIVLAVGIDPLKIANAPSGAFQILNLSFKAKDGSVSSSTVSINTANSQLVSTQSSAFALSSTSLTLSLNPVIGAKLSFSNPVPINPQTVSSSFTTEIMMDTAGKDTYGVDAIVKYDATKLKLETIVPTSGNGFNSFPLNTVDNVAGVGKFSANIGSNVLATAVKGSAVSIAKLTFVPIAVSTNTLITFDHVLGNRNDSNIIEKTISVIQDPVDILNNTDSLSITADAASASPVASVVPSVSPLPTPILTPSPIASIAPSPSPDPQSISMILGFQGKTRTDVAKNLSVTISYVQNNLGVPVTNSYVADTTGKVSIVLQPGNYVFLIKAPGYLARKFGSVSNPIAVTSLTSTLDFSNTLLLGGDFFPDGQVNEIDYTSRFLTAFGLNQALTDLDGSGQVNNLDFAIMRANWNLVDDAL